MAEAVILIGLQGAGKTTYYQSTLAPTHAIISGDVHGSRNAQMNILDSCIREGRSFALDNTNVTRAVRAPFISRAKEAGYRVIACYFDIPVRTAIWRNSRRQDKKAIPVPGILRSAKTLEPPSKDEGFDEIRVIRDQQE